MHCLREYGRDGGTKQKGEAGRDRGLGGRVGEIVMGRRGMEGLSDETKMIGIGIEEGDRGMGGRGG